MYPTLARIALDILPIPASSVGCEQLFSRAAQVATDRRSRLGPEKFEWIECLHYHWKRDLPDFIRNKPEEVEEVDLDFEYIMVEETELNADDSDIDEDTGF